MLRPLSVELDDETVNLFILFDLFSFGKILRFKIWLDEEEGSSGLENWSDRRSDVSVKPTTTVRGWTSTVWTFLSEMDWSTNSSMWCDLCDQMLELKVAQFYPKVAQKYPQQFYIKRAIFHNGPKVLLNFLAIFVTRFVPTVQNAQVNWSFISISSHCTLLTFTRS